MSVAGESVPFRSGTRMPRVPTDTIVLIGFMGAGKSTVGRLLADRLGIRYVDADHELEARAGRSIPSFFEAGEESAFRAMEVEVVRSLVAQREPHVVSTGGGWGADPARVRSLPKGVVSIWLRVGPEVAVARASGEGLSQSEPVRPLLAVDDPVAEARDLIASREPGYAAASFAIETDDRHPGQIVDDIIDRLET